MNCRRVEKLMPLYVEGDLRFKLARRVNLHVERCRRCCALADEYKDSQSWLQSAKPPEFEVPFFNELKRDVLKQAEKANERASVLASLAAPWSRRQMLALAAAVLVVLSTVAFYLYATRVSNRSAISQGVAQKAHDEADKLRDSSPAVGTEKAFRASSKAPPHVRRVVGLRSLDLHEQQHLVAERIKSPLGAEAADRVNSSLSGVGSRTDGDGDSQPVLRIEFQTSDPNIRIVWFAPKETDSHQSKPATD